MKERKLGWDTGTIKINSVEFFKQIEDKDKEIKKLKAIIDQARTKLGDVKAVEWEEVVDEVGVTLEYGE